MKRIVCLFFIFVATLFASDDIIANKGDNRYFVAVTKIEYNEAKAKLGKKLFFDKRLSEDGKVSCESCHNLYWDFSGTLRHVEDGVLDPVSVLSVGLNYMFFNDGKIRSIYDQVDRSITSLDELATDPNRLVLKLSKIDEYVNSFAQTYPNGLNYENIKDALVEFERAITSVNSPFDKYLLGDDNALTKEQKKGLELFKEVGCVACHNGVNLGSNVEQIVNFYEFVIKSEHSDNNDLSEGAKNHFINPPKDGEEVDVFLCKHSITGKFYKPKLDFMRIPPLRNVARTRPYYRCGKKTSLQQTIQDMSKIQLNYQLSDNDAELIYKFLLSLDGEIPRILK